MDWTAGLPNQKEIHPRTRLYDMAIPIRNVISNLWKCPRPKPTIRPTRPQLAGINQTAFLSQWGSRKSISASVSCKHYLNWTSLSGNMSSQRMNLWQHGSTRREIHSYFSEEENWPFISGGVNLEKEQKVNKCRPTPRLPSDLQPSRQQPYPSLLEKVKWRKGVKEFFLNSFTQ